MLNYTITNPAAPQNANPTPVYLGQANTLAFTCSANLNMQAQSGDKIYISLDTRLLNNPAAVTLDSENWQLDSCTLTGNKYVVTCVLHSPFSLLETFVIKLLGLTPQSACSAQIGARAQFGGRPYSGHNSSVAVMNPPSGHKDLRDALTFALSFNDFQQYVPQQFYRSDAGLQTPISNTLHLMVACDSPPLPLSAAERHTPEFICSFTYGADEHALTDALKSTDPHYNALSTAWHINCQLEGSEADNWIPIQPNPEGATPEWKIRASTKVLFDRNNPVLDVYFSHVISKAPAGTAVMYIQWHDFPGYNDGALAIPIHKSQAGNSIVDFNSPQNRLSIAFQKPVDLHWKVFGGEKVRISWDEGTHQQTFPVYNTQAPALFYEGSASVVPNSPLSNFYIDLDGVVDEKAAVQVSVSDFPPPQIKTFTGAIVLREDHTAALQLNWLVENLGNNGFFELNGTKYDGRAYNGLPFQLQLDPAGMVFPKTFSLTAIDGSMAARPDTSSTITVDLPDWIKPEIKVFESKVDRDSNNIITAVHLKIQVRNVYTATQCTLNGAPLAIQNDVVLPLTMPVSREHPLPGGFMLNCVNPLVPSATRYIPIVFTLREKTYSCLDAIGINAAKQQFITLGFTNENQFELWISSLNNLEQPQVMPIMDGQHFTGSRTNSYMPLLVAPDGTQAMVKVWGNYSFTLPDHPKPVALHQIPISTDIMPRKSPFLYSPDNKFAFVLQGVGAVAYFNPDNPAEKPPFKTILNHNHYNDLWAIALSPDGRRLYACDMASSMIWYCDKDNILKGFTDGYPMKRDDKGTSLAIGKNGWLYFLGSNLYGINTLAEGKPVQECLVTLNKNSLSQWMYCSSSGDFLIRIDAGKPDVYGIGSDGKLTLLKTLDIENISDVKMTDDNTRILVNKDKVLYVYDADTGVAS